MQGYGWRRHGVSLSCRGDRDHEIRETPHVVETLRDKRLSGRGPLETEGSRISAASSAGLTVLNKSSRWMNSWVDLLANC
jgi:hypothetical protein